MRDPVSDLLTSNASVGTNATGELITSGLPVARALRSFDHRPGRILAQYPAYITCCAAPLLGRVKQKHAPRGEFPVAHKWPPWDSTIERLIQELRSDIRFLQLPVIAVTASAMLGDRERAIAAGFDSYIAKPINLSELRKHLELPSSPNRNTGK